MATAPAAQSAERVTSTGETARSFPNDAGRTGIGVTTAKRLAAVDGGLVLHALDSEMRDGVVAAEQLQDGDAGLDGRFGTGSGSWRLFVTAEGRLQVMSLGYSPDGFLANLSRGRPPAQDVAISRPDLVVGTPTVSDSAPVAGAAFTLSATVRNRGEAAAPSTTLRYYRSDDAAISSADTPAGTDAVIGLGANGSSGESIALTAPADGGRYYYGACVDGVVGESDASNNCSSAVAVTVPDATAGNADLIVASPSVSEDRPAPGTAFTLSATVRNAGSGDAVATTLRYYRSTDATISTSDTLVGADTVAALVASGSSTHSVTVTAPSAAGTHYYGACVDAVEGERETTNNCSAAVEVSVAAPKYPDLVVGTPAVSESDLQPDVDFTLSTTVTNQGDAGAGATTLRYYRSTDATISTSDTSLGTDTVVDTDAVIGLAAASSSPASVTLSAPSTVGTHYYGACVDPVGGESDTTNNCSSSIAVTASNYGAVLYRFAGGACVEPTAWFALDHSTEEQAEDAVVEACLSTHDSTICESGSPTLFPQCLAVIHATKEGACGLSSFPAPTKSGAEAAGLAWCRPQFSSCTVLDSACNAASNSQGRAAAWPGTDERR